MTSQAALDNCDVAGEHLTVEYVMHENRSPTSHLDTVPMSKAESAKLFKLNTFLLTDNCNKEEKEHLVKNVLAVGVGNLLARERPEAALVLRKHLPRRHKHANSGRKITPALVTISAPYPYMETKNSDTVLLCMSRQRKFLQRVAEWKQKDPSFMKDLSKLEDSEAVESDRVEAELRVKAACKEYGENISHGDLLTVAMFQNAKLIMAGSVTAFGRLEFLGIMRLGLLHLKMKYVCGNFSSMMKQEVNYSDIGRLSWLASITNKPSISNRPKDIKKNDSSFEHHDQVMQGRLLEYQSRRMYIFGYPVQEKCHVQASHLFQE